MERRRKKNQQYAVMQGCQRDQADLMFKAEQEKPDPSIRAASHKLEKTRKGVQEGQQKKYTASGGVARSMPRLRCRRYPAMCRFVLPKASNHDRAI